MLATPPSTCYQIYTGLVTFTQIICQPSCVIRIFNTLISNLPFTASSSNMYLTLYVENTCR